MRLYIHAYVHACVSSQPCLLSVLSRTHLDFALWEFSATSATRIYWCGNAMCGELYCGQCIFQHRSSPGASREDVNRSLVNGNEVLEGMHEMHFQHFRLQRSRRLPPRDGGRFRQGAFAFFREQIQAKVRAVKVMQSPQMQSLSRRSTSLGREVSISFDNKFKQKSGLSM